MFAELDRGDRFDADPELVGSREREPAQRHTDDGRCPRCGAVTEVLLVTHDSFAIPDDLVAAFTKATGCTLKVLQSGDAGALTNKLVLTKGSPIGDAVFGIDNTFASRAVSEGCWPTTRPLCPRALRHMLFRERGRRS